MATTEAMTWNKAQRRWLKKYRGKMYSVSPKQLGAEPTKESSRQAANEWWATKQTELDAQLGEAKKHPAQLTNHYEQAMENWRWFAKWHRKFGSIQAAQKAETMIDFLTEALKHDEPPFPLTKRNFDPIWAIVLDHPSKDEQALRLMWFERKSHIAKTERDEKDVPKEDTIRGHIEDYLNLKKAQAQAKGKLGTYHTTKQWLGIFKEWVEPSAAIQAINESLWEQFFIHLTSKIANGDYSPTTAKDYQSAARTFIKSRWERRFIELPRNLNSRQLSISIPPKNSVLFTTEELTAMLNAASPRQKLYLLLMLNCGMYPVDIALLQQDEVNWDEGRIIRKRTKTRDRSNNVPKVDYLLWRETFELLKQHRSQNPALVLINDNGSPLWQEKETAEGKFDRNNNIKTAYFQLLAKKMKLPVEQRKPLKSIRKTSATLLENSQYGRFAEHFLGEAPHTIASKHYTHKNGLEFDTAILWLGEQLGIK